MKITGPKLGGAGRVGTPSPAGQPRAGAGFTVQVSGPAREAPATTRAASVGGLGSLDALIALQQVEGPTERRRRAVNRAGRMLDVLDELKLSMLDDGAGADGVLAKLNQAVREQRADTEDPRLEGVLDEIETRAAVEMAKREGQRHAIRSHS